MKPPDYTFDPERLAALESYGILDTPAEVGFDDIVQLAAQLCEVPAALVSLVSADRQWFKARVGFDSCQTDLGSSVCVHALVEPDLLVIPDLTKDPRTKDNPLVVGEPRIRFYAGAPFRGATGHALGTLCVVDLTARPDGLTPPQAAGLRNLSRQVTTQLDLRRAIAERDALVAEQRRAEARRNALLNLGDCLRDTGSAADMMALASGIVGQTLRASRAGFGRLDDAGEYLIVEGDWNAEGMESISGRNRLADYGELAASLIGGEVLVVEDVRTDPRTAADPEPLLTLGLAAFVTMPVRQSGRTVTVFLVHDREPRVWPDETLAFLRNVVDRVEVGVARLQAEADQRVLNQELSHRMKNSFAMVQAIASQTLRHVPDRGPVEAFIQRLHALSAAHDVLLQKNWAAAMLGSIVTNVLTPLVPADRVHIEGPALDLAPRATLSVSLLLHELTTNALKHGSLLESAGRVRVTWHVTDPDGSAELVLDWKESDGPSVSQPTHRGFGSRLIRAGLAGTGGVDVRYLLEGFQARFTAPLVQVQA